MVMNHEGNDSGCYPVRCATGGHDPRNNSNLLAIDGEQLPSINLSRQMSLVPFQYLDFFSN